MLGEDHLRAEARVIEVVSARICRVALSNGHRMLACVPARMRLGARIVPGDTMWIRVSPCDLSVGRIEFNEEEK